MCLWSLFVFLLVSIVAVKSEAEDAYSLLRAALDKYANPSTYYIKGARESTARDEVQRRWEEESFTVAKASGTEYRYEIRIPDRWNVVVADGESEWEFQPWRNEYVQHSIPTMKPDPESPDDVIRYATERQARFYIEDLQQGIDLKTAEFLHPEMKHLAT
jgi:hypothetical protein